MPEAADINFSTAINNMTAYIWGIMDANSAALFGLLAFFVGIGVVLMLIRKFTS